MTRKLTILSILSLILILGAGCGKKEVVTPEGDVDTDVLASLSAEEATKAIVFKKGSGFVIQQTVVPFEGKFYIDEPKRSQRFVELSMFSPKHQAELIWQLEQFVETDESKQAREEFEESEHEEGAEPPEKKYGQLVSSGMLGTIEFVKSHELYLPIKWKMDEDHARSSSVWVSDDVFQELSRTRNSTVYLDAVETAGEVTLGNEELQTAVANLRETVRDVADRTDVDFMKAEGDVVEWPIIVNQQEIKVQAIKARNWFGEIVVLNNPDNPLILKFEFNPNVEGIEAGSEEMNIIRGLLGYEVVEIKL
jgi:hypothetical protein